LDLLVSRSGNAKSANQHLQFLVSKAAEAKEQQPVVWARGMLAILAALGGRDNEMREALAGLEQSGSHNAAASVFSRRTRAALLATRGNQRDRVEAIRLLEGLIAAGADQPPDRLLLVQLYEANNEWPKARKQLLLLREMPGGRTSASLAAYVSAMHGEVEEAEQALGQLEKTLPDTLPVLSLKAQVLHRQGRKKEAVALLCDHATKRGQEFGRVAVVLEQLKEYQAAEQMYHQHRKKSPNPTALLAYAGFLGRQKRCEEALAICARAWEKCPGETVSSVCLDILQGAENNKPAQKEAERQIQAALQKHPSSAVLRHALANLLVLQQRYDAAEATYRGLIDRDTRNVLARNNLAWLLACQKKQLSAAVELIDKALTLGGPNPHCSTRRPLCAWRLGNPKKRFACSRNWWSIPRQRLDTTSTSPRRKWRITTASRPLGRSNGHDSSD
jgi:tetratricopeptide (TPR) repeat protein